MDVAEVPALGTNLVALGSLGPSAPSATPNSASAAHLGPAWPILRHAAILRESSQRWSPGKRQKERNAGHRRECRHAGERGSGQATRAYLGAPTPTTTTVPAS